jgi:hypothetical protein
MAKAVYRSKDLKRAYELRDSAESERELRAAIIFITLATTSVTAGDIRRIWGISDTTLRSDLQSVRHPRPKGPGSAANNRLMTFKEEGEFLDRHAGRSKRGGAVDMLKIRELYNEKVGRSASKGTFYQMLKRHGWRKVSPSEMPGSVRRAPKNAGQQPLRWRWVKGELPA